MMSHVSLPGRTAYSTSKAALLGFTKALALEFAPEQITVNGISPGPCTTEINRPLLENPELTQFFLSRIPWAAGASRRKLANWPYSYAAKPAGFTGTEMVIDGGGRRSEPVPRNVVLMLGIEWADRIIERQSADLDVLRIDFTDADAMMQPQVVLAAERNSSAPRRPGENVGDTEAGNEELTP